MVCGLDKKNAFDLPNTAVHDLYPGVGIHFNYGINVSMVRHQAQEVLARRIYFSLEILPHGNVLGFL